MNNLNGNHPNLAETLAREMKEPVPINSPDTDSPRHVALPPGWTIQRLDDEALLAHPRRKRAAVVLADAESFVAYVRRHGSLDNCTVWCAADYAAGKVEFTAIVNDHGEAAIEADWRDHIAQFAPPFSEEWQRWTTLKNNTHPFTQAEFAVWIEDNLKDIAAQEGYPTGTQMLQMALNLEVNQDLRFKSALRLQSGGVQMTFVQDDDQATIAQMQLFERFALGIPVFWNGDGYRLDARLRYRVRDGKAFFWYELVRPAKVLEAAALGLIAHIRDKTGVPFFFGSPGIKGSTQ